MGLEKRAGTTKGHNFYKCSVFAKKKKKKKKTTNGSPKLSVQYLLTTHVHFCFANNARTNKDMDLRPVPNVSDG